MGRVSPACTGGAADGTGGAGGPSTELRATPSVSRGGCCAATPTLTAAATITIQIVRAIILAPPIDIPSPSHPFRRGADGSTPTSCMQDGKTTPAGWRLHVAGGATRSGGIFRFLAPLPRLTVARRPGLAGSCLT